MTVALVVTTNNEMFTMEYAPPDYKVLRDGVGDILIIKDGYYNGEPDVIGMSLDEAQSLGDALVCGTGGIVHWKNPPQTGGVRHD